MNRVELERKVAELRRELSRAESELSALGGGESSVEVGFLDLFDLDEIQAIQDAFSSAAGVASLITTPDGEPITRPSNFTRLCNDIIRKTEKGRCNCRQSDTLLGRFNPRGATIQPCLSSGLWDGGASISVDGRHIASWFVGQVRNEHVDKEATLAYAREIGADEVEFVRAFEEVPVMSLDRFKEVGRALFLLANQMSWIAYQNLMLGDHIREIQATNREVLTLRNYLSNIIDSMPSLLVGVDVEGRITHWNMRAEAATGMGQGEVKGRLLADVLPDLGMELSRVSSAIARGAPAIRERVPAEVDGERRYRDVSIYPLVANGVQGAVVRVDDITEKVRIEEMMIQSEKMVSVGGLAAGMAHEINNPLAAILGNARLLRKRLLEESPRNRRTAQECGVDLDGVMAYVRARSVNSMLDAVIESGERAGRVVTNMLGFSRKTDGAARNEDVTVILNKAVELVKSGHDLEHSYNFKDIVFDREFGDGSFLVRCDAGRLEQVFFNILNNGAQAMTFSMKETGREPRFVLRCNREENTVRVEIEDNGPGMTEEVRRRVFEPFFTTKAAGVGTGLGMSVSYFIVTEQLGGTMRAESGPGPGATFVIEIPASEE
ncbi:PocR ligand-binding domain-containing protein [uncultured Pseudodesulfovibrio sp.]|uniref:PocR ligand-binding domain-containing protein n=1 Tax=uncultured Pseudodesulfovibrio sp. TaxID=2035858 RepID=UPI0029C6F09A|nr:PocR ligand-binding domain-containing protein [uncultured Pseudodesulfovibrio sp.]